MKSSLIILVFTAIANFCMAQNIKKSIDYQYFRDDKNYYAYEIYQNPELSDVVFITFSTNKAIKKLEKLYLQVGEQTHKLKFKAKEEEVVSDNPELKFYVLSLNISDFKQSNLPCDMQIVFKVNDEMLYKLPFQKCLIDERFAKI